MNLKQLIGKTEIYIAKDNEKIYMAWRDSHRASEKVAEVVGLNLKEIDLNENDSLNNLDWNKARFSQKTSAVFGICKECGFVNGHESAFVDDEIGNQARYQYECELCGTYHDTWE